MKFFVPGTFVAVVLLVAASDAAVTPDIQLLFDPADHPGEEAIAVFGARMRIAF